MDAKHLQFRDNFFDFIFIIAILHHLNDKDFQEIILEAKRVLKPSGYILIWNMLRFQALILGLRI